MAKKKKKCKHKRLYGNYITYGKLSKRDWHCVMELIDKGVNVYHMYGSPHCGPTGCP